MNPYDVNIPDPLGPDALPGFFSALFQILKPAMPFVIFFIALSLAATFIITMKKTFSFNSLRRNKEDEYDYKDDE